MFLNVLNKFSGDIILLIARGFYVICPDNKPKLSGNWEH
ncbi:Uncharacterized protein dnm_052460 [Desulfonema magnum]|uniref:Uncharacterized protein n=1 Tax=Desulfonema magnum TaxID=45655 RepID=A0A975BPE4_9BACT|nr:Uncharacterized protein dnm_052460 [Desulfonema magnum]